MRLVRFFHFIMYLLILGGVLLMLDLYIISVQLMFEKYFNKWTD